LCDTSFDRIHTPSVRVCTCVTFRIDIYLHFIQIAFELQESVHNITSDTRKNLFVLSKAADVTYKISFSNDFYNDSISISIYIYIYPLVKEHNSL